MQFSDRVRIELLVDRLGDELFTRDLTAQS